MNGSLGYEKIVKVSNVGKRFALKISVIFSYIALGIIILLATLNNVNNALPIFITGALVLFGVVKLTWKYLYLEYEYSFSCGTLCVSKIYGKRTRKQIIEADIKSLIMIAPATQENIEKAEHLDAEERVMAVSDENAENIWIALSGDINEKRTLVFFEADERSLGILKLGNPYAFSKKI